MNVETDLVNQISFKQRLRQHATTQHTNIFTFLFFQSPYKLRSVFSNKK
jgi:hypothetical protein